MTVAGGNDAGVLFDQLDIADMFNHRVVRWKAGASNGEVVAGGHGDGDRLNQLDHPSDVVIDRKRLSLVICDRRNGWLIRVSHHDLSSEPSVLLKYGCERLALDHNGDVYMSNTRTDAVARWKEGEAQETIIAGGNGKGDALNQFNRPEYLAVDPDFSVYVSDSNNNRVIKWSKCASEGVIFAGGEGADVGAPMGLILDHTGSVYVVTQKIPRVIRFSNNSRAGTVVADGHEPGQQSDRLSAPQGLAFDRLGNLYVVDSFNHRVLKFLVNRCD